jgi:predicted deacylase
MTSVRSRLMLVLALILILPAAAAIAAVGFLAPNQVKVSARGAMVQAAGSTSSMLVEQCRSLGESARGLALQAGSPGFAAAAAEVFARQPGSFVALLDGATVKASAGQLPQT